MAKPQNSPRGLFYKVAAAITTLTGTTMTASGAVSGATVTATGAVQGATINLSGNGSLAANSTGNITWDQVTSVMPGNTTAGLGAIMKVYLSTTGFIYAINTTGTTWRYLNMSSRPFG